MEISLDDVFTFIRSSVIPNFTYNKGKHLDIATGDIIGTDEVKNLLGINSTTVLLDEKRDNSERNIPITSQDIDVLYEQEEGLNRISPNSIDVLTMFFVIHHLSDRYLETMNRIANVTKAGSLLIMSDYDVEDFNILDEMEYRHMYNKADTTADYGELVRKSKVSYTSFKELKESMETFGFYLLFKGGNTGPYNQYSAVFRKSSAPRRVYIPVFVHPVHSIEAGNTAEYLGYNMTDEELYNEYKRMKTT